MSMGVSVSACCRTVAMTVAMTVPGACLVSAIALYLIFVKEAGHPVSYSFSDKFKSISFLFLL